MYTKTNTTTAAAVLLLEADTRAAHHARRTAAAHSRHAIDNGGTWTATAEGVRAPIHRQTADQLTQTADIAAFKALRARAAASGLHFLHQLQNGAQSDNKHRRMTDTAARIAELERERHELRAIASYHRAQAQRKTTTTAEKQSHRRRAAEATKAADRIAAEINSLYKLLELTASDRADIVQAALVAALNHDHRTNPNGAFAAMCAAAGRAIAKVASPNALTAHRTKWRETTPEHAAELIRIYGEGAKIPHNVKGAISTCYDTIETRTIYTDERTEDGRKLKKEVPCIVSHYSTAAPYISYEAYTTDNGENAELATNGGINAIGTATDAAEIADFLSRANLSEREAAIVYMTADQTAAKHGQQAVNAYYHRRAAEILTTYTERIEAAAKLTDYTKRTEAEAAAVKAMRRAYREADKTAEAVRIAAQWENAFDRLNISTKADTRAAIKSRIKAKLTEAQKPHEVPTKAEAAERDRRTWERMQRNSRRGNAADIGANIDLVAWTEAAEPIKTAAIITWTAPKGEVITMTKEEAEAAERERREAATEHYTKYGANFAFLEMRRRIRDSHSRTAYAAHDARHAALVFLDRMSTEEQAEIMRAEAAERAAERAAYRAELERIKTDTATAAAKRERDKLNRRPLYITVKKWNSSEPTQRLAIINRTIDENRRLCFVIRSRRKATKRTKA